MKKYIGTKIIKADPNPMTYREYCESRGWECPKDRELAETGYKVGYPDANGEFNGLHEGGCDYISWSPQDVFEAAYREGSGVPFGFALEAMKKGMAARLPQWAPDVHIKAQFPDENSKMTAPYLYVESRFGRVPWKETMIELFSDDWMIIE